MQGGAEHGVPSKQWLTTEEHSDAGSIEMEGLVRRELPMRQEWSQ